MGQRHAHLRTLCVGLTALAAIACGSCSSEKGKGQAASHQEDASSPQREPAGTQSVGTTRPAEPAILPCVAALLPHLKDEDPNTRRMAAIALGRLGEPEAIWPLIQAGADDPNRGVRLAAVEAVTWLSLDPNSWLRRAVRKRLLTREASRVEAAAIEIRDGIMLAVYSTDCSMGVNWRALQEAGVERGKEVRVPRRKMVAGELMCVLCAATEGRMGFSIERVHPLHFSSTAEIARGIRAARRVRARLAAMRRWSGSTEAGRRTLAAIESSVRFSRIDEAQLADVIQYLRETTGLRFVVDWPELKKAGVERSTLIRAEHYPRAGMRIASSLPPGEEGLRAVLDAACEEACGSGDLDIVVDDDVVFISTPKGVERRMAARSRPMPRLILTRADEEAQAVGRLTAALKDKDPLVRRSAAWALDEIDPARGRTQPTGQGVRQ